MTRLTLSVLVLAMLAAGPARAQGTVSDCRRGADGKAPAYPCCMGRDADGICLARWDGIAGSVASDTQETTTSFTPTPMPSCDPGWNLITLSTGANWCVRELRAPKETGR